METRWSEKGSYWVARATVTGSAFTICRKQTVSISLDIHHAWKVACAHTHLLAHTHSEMATLFSDENLFCTMFVYLGNPRTTVITVNPLLLSNQHICKSIRQILTRFLKKTLTGYQSFNLGACVQCFKNKIILGPSDHIQQEHLLMRYLCIYYINVCTNKENPFKSWKLKNQVSQNIHHSFKKMK